MSTIANTDSTARDHLANERNMLAWTRTSLAVAGLGILVVRIKFATDNTSEIFLNTLFGVVLVLLAWVIFLMGYHRFCKTREFLMEGLYPASIPEFWVVMAFAHLIFLGAIGILLW